MTPADLQRWLNGQGASLAVDGRFGPASRLALLRAFENRNAPALTGFDERAIAEQIGCTVRQLRAVAAVESSGGGFDRSGRPKILWERHWFWRLTKGIFGVLWYSRRDPGGYTIDDNRNGINDSWEKLAMACANDPLSAFASCSWGKFQIMGFHAASLGYANALEFAWAMRGSERNHYDALARFIRHNGLARAMQQISADPASCHDFARGYNGIAYARMGYHTKLAIAFREAKP